MQKVFEKILERFDSKIAALGGASSENAIQDTAVKEIMWCKDIVKQVVEEYNNGWIPVSERLPEKSGLYLVCYKNKDCYPNIEVFLNNRFIYEEHVIAWQPLPEPYKGE